MTELFDALKREVRDYGRRCDIAVAKYDPDALIGHIMRWCAAKDAVLTAEGPISFDEFAARFGPDPEVIPQ